MLIFTPEDLIKLGLAILAGGVIGLEREFRDKAAGFRTLIFICLGAAVFTILSSRLALDKDPGRIAAQIVTGVGFLGAGVIMRDGGRVTGLTTAATIWLVAALGMSIGGGEYVLAGALAVVALLVLWIFPWFEHWIDNFREERVYEIVCPLSEAKLAALDSAFRSHRLRVLERHQVKQGANMRCRWTVAGAPRRHAALLQQFFADPEINEVNS
jgi:putative Mg2+ transporter-C (MgtC) family protein